MPKPVSLSPGTNLLEFRQVWVKAAELTLLQDISFTIQPGEKTVLHGPSGSGKSTVLKTLLGVHVPAAGAVLFQGQAVTATSIATFRAAVAYIGQQPTIEGATVRDALELPFTFKAHRHARPDLTTLGNTLQRLHLDPAILSRSTTVLSGGEKQRIAVARALLLNKTVFIADEVTSALDPASKTALLQLFTDPSYTVVSVSHDPQWFQLGTHFLKLDGGRIVRDATTLE